MLSTRSTAQSLTPSTLLTFVSVEFPPQTHLPHPDPAAGASDDWYKSLGMRYAFTTELRDTGHYGFELPKEQIIESGEEIWAAFEVVIDRVQQP